MDKIDQAMVAAVERAAATERDAAMGLEVKVVPIPGHISPRGLPVQLLLPLDLTDFELVEVYKFVGSAIDEYRKAQAALQAAAGPVIATPDHTLVTARIVPKMS